MVRYTEWLEPIKLRKFRLAVYSLYELSSFVCSETDTAEEFGDHLGDVFGGIEYPANNENTDEDFYAVSYDEDIY